MVYELIKQLKTKQKLLRVFENEQEVVKYIEEEKLTFSFPYIFTNIALSNGLHLFQKYKGITCSPEKLRKMLVGGI